MGKSRHTPIVSLVHWIVARHSPRSWLAVTSRSSRGKRNDASNQVPMGPRTEHVQVWQRARSTVKSLPSIKIVD